MARTTGRARGGAGGTTLLSSSDFTAYLHEKAEQLAPGDLETMLKQADAARRRADEQRGMHPRLSRHAELALQLVTDHAEGQCPQIPYYTVCLLTVALLYFVDPLDVIPDWIPGAGGSDDGLMFELAFELARPGVERYCTWKGISTEGVLLHPPEPARRRPAKKRPR